MVLAPFLPFLAGSALAGVAAAVSSAGAAEAVFWRKVRVLARKRVRSIFFFFLGAGGV